MRGFELIASLTSKWRDAGRGAADAEVYFMVQVGGDRVPYTPVDIKVPVKGPTQIYLRRVIQ